MQLHTIILKEDVSVDPRKYGTLVAPALGVTVLEAKIAVRRGRGIFLADLPADGALAIAESLRADGVECWCLPNDDVPFLDPPRRVPSVERTDAALKYRSAGGTETSLLPWESIGTISLGAIALPAFRDQYAGLRFENLPAFHRLEDPAARELLREQVMLKMGESESRRPLPAATKPRVDPASIYEEIQRRHSKEAKVVVDVVAEDGSLWLRVPMDEIDYRQGEAAVRFGEAWGFTEFVKELQRRRPDATTEVGRRFVPGAPFRDLVFPTTEDLNRYTSWNAIRRILCQRDATSSPSPAPPEPPTGGGSSTSSPAPAPKST